MTPRSKALMLSVALFFGASAPLCAGTQAVTFGVHRKMESELISPGGPGPYPGVLLMHTAMGLESYDVDYAERLAGRGYVVLVPRYLAAYHAITVLKVFRQHVFQADGPSIYDDFVDGLALLRSQPNVRGSKLGAIGFSAGGYFALWLAATGKVQAGVSYYGAVHAADSDPNLELFRRTFTSASSPVLILHGTEDSTVPIRFAELLDKILTERNCPHEFHQYPAGHRFDRSLLGSDRAVVNDAWTRTAAFLDATLKH